MDEVRRPVRRRESDGDDEVGRRESQQDQHEYLAAPLWKQPLEHGNAALSVGAGLRNTLIKWERRK